MLKLELKVPPPLVALLIGAAMWGIARSTPGLVLPGVARLAICAILVSGGLVVIVSGLRSFRRHGTTVNPTAPQSSTKLVTGGIYRFTRNPMYLGLLLWLSAFGIWLASPSALLLCIVFILYMNRFQIAPEERALEGLFGDAYRSYKARVRRWI